MRSRAIASRLPVGPYVVDILRGSEIIEIQTRHFSAVSRKVLALIEDHDLVLVTPVAVTKRIVRLSADEGEAETSRRSPKRGSVVDVFDELVSFPQLLTHPRFAVEVALISEEEVRRRDPRHGWRRGGWVVDHHRLVEVVGRVRLGSAADLARLLPAGLVAPFPTSDLATALGRPRHLAQRMAYCLAKSGVIVPVGKAGNAIRYAPGLATAADRMYVAFGQGAEDQAGPARFATDGSGVVEARTGP